MLNVLEGKNGKSKISGIMPLPKGDEVAPQYNDTIVFSVDEYQQGNKEPFNQLSEGIRRMILRCKELEDINTDTGDENNGVDLGSDDVPF
jgi:hypothetical protein